MCTIRRTPTRAADSLCAGVRALAALEGREYAIPDDVKRLYPHVMRHRVVLAIASPPAP